MATPPGRSLFDFVLFSLRDTLLPPCVCLQHAVGALAVAINRGLTIMLFSGDWSFYGTINRVRISLESGDAKQRGNECNMGPLN